MNQSCKISTTQSTIFSNFLFTGLLILGMLGLLSPSVCSAQTWTGTTNTDWNVSTNWNTNTVPTGATDVLIPNTANKPIIGSTTDAEAESVKILSGGALTINGSLALFPETENGLKNDGTVNNNGTLKIGSATSTIYSGIFSDGVFNNSGTIKIDKVLFDGIITNHTFINTGSIIIGAVGTIGINGIQISGTFNNQINGYISVDHAGNGILNQITGIFSNSGTIDIGGINEGIYHIGKYGIQNKGKFINAGLGIISIDRTVKSCVHNEIGTFSNTGFINLASNMLALNEAIVNFAGCTLTNDHCATIEANGALHNKGAVNNLGFIKLNNYGGILPHTNTGTITNDGVIENIIGDAIPGNLINHDLIIKPISGECIISNVLQRGNESSFNVEDVWYFDQDRSLPAGNYIQSPNTFLQGNLSLGENRVFFLFQDNDYGCLSMASQRITLLPDHTAPEVTCKQALVEISASGNGVLDPAQLFQSGFDDCGGEVLPVSTTPSTFNCAQLGQIISVKLTASDEAGNTATCTTTVTLRDAIAPTMRCKPVTINLNAAGQATLTVAQVDNGSFDNCAITFKGISQTLFTCANVGINSVILGGNDASNNKGMCTATVTVKDLIIPVAKCKNITANLDANGLLALAPAMVDNGSTDNCSLTFTVTPAAFNCGTLGANIVTLRAKDASGNSKTCTATVTVKDATAPNALCKNATIILDDLGNATLGTNAINNGSTDACGIATMTLSKTQFNCSDVPGPLQTITLTLKDVNNNSSSCTAQVTVKDNMAPTAYCEDVTVSLDASGKATVYSAVLADDSYDNCSIWSFTPTAKVYNTTNIGYNNLTIYLKDGSNNTATCVSVVTVVPFSGLRGSGGDREVALETVLSHDFEFSVYPNPTVGNALVDFELAAGQPVALRVLDLTGRMVLNQQLEGTEGRNQIRLDMVAMANGVYVVEIQAGDFRGQKRLVLQAD